MWSARTTVVALLVVTAVSLAALIALGWRSLDAFEATIARVLREVSDYAAEQTAQQIQRDLRSPVFDLLEKVDHGAIRSFDIPVIATTVRAAGAENFNLVRTYFVWSFAKGSVPELTTSPADRRVLFYSGSQDHERAGAGTPAAVAAHGFVLNPPLAQLLLRDSEQWASSQKPFALAYLDFEGRHYQVVYHFLLANNRPQLAGVEGFLSDADYLKEHYFPAIVAKQRRVSGDNPATAQMAVSIFDNHGVEIFQTGRSLAAKYDAHTEFPFLFFELGLFDSLSPYYPEIHQWSVRTGYQTGDIEALARSQAAPQRWAWGLVSLIAAFAIGLTARSAVREMRLSAMKSEFVSSVSHDLKTPLAKIQLYAQTLESGRAKSHEKVLEYSRVIDVQAQKLTHLIQELLDFSKIEAGVREYPMDELDLRDVLKSTIELFAQELSAENGTSEVVLPPTPVRVLGNFDGLQQLFGNLISNALKYSPGERYLRVSLASTNGHATVAVTDRGIGVAKREQRKIFRKFYRSPSSASAVTGSGIGLAIVDHVVRAHGGTIDVASAPARGTTFTVTLPLMADVAEGWA